MSVKIKEYPGTPIGEGSIASGKILTVSYRPKVAYAWAPGIAIGQFLAGLKHGRIVGSRCTRCGRTVVPPRAFCEWCLKPVNEWVELPDSGVVNTFSISYIAADTSRLSEPVVPAVIIIDGTSEAGILHVIGEVRPEEVRIGMRVKAVWKQPEERTGSITDIKYFRPIEGD